MFKVDYICIIKNTSISEEDFRNTSIENLEDQIFLQKLQPSENYLDEITSSKIVSEAIISSCSSSSENLKWNSHLTPTTYNNESMDVFHNFDGQSIPFSHKLSIPKKVLPKAFDQKLSSQNLSIQKVQAESLRHETSGVHEGSGKNVIVDKGQFLKDSPAVSVTKNPKTTSDRHLQKNLRIDRGIGNNGGNNVTLLEHSAKQLVEFPHDKNMAVIESRILSGVELKEGVGHRVDRRVDGGNSNTTNISLKPLSGLHQDEMSIASSAQVDIDVPASIEPRSLHEVSRRTAGYIDNSGHQTRMENWVRRASEIGIISTSLTSDQPLTIITLEHSIDGVDIKFTTSSKELTELLSRNQQELRSIFRQSELQSYQFSFSNGSTGGHSSRKTLHGDKNKMTPNLMAEVAVTTQFFPATGVDKRI